jgi:hypothetical protein
MLDFISWTIITWWWLDYKINHIKQRLSSISSLTKKPIEMIIPYFVMTTFNLKSNFLLQMEGIIGSKSSLKLWNDNLCCFHCDFFIFFKFVVQRILWKGSWWPTFQKGENISCLINLGINFLYAFSFSLDYGKVLKT